MARDKREDSTKMSGIQKVLVNDADFLKGLLQQSLQEILKAEFFEYIKAEPYERTTNRTSYRNGSYVRSLKTRVGKIELSVPRDRSGQFRTELFERYQRSEKAFVLNLLEMYLHGVSTRKVKKIVEEVCGIDISISQLSELNKNLDEQIKKWRERKLKKSYPYLMVDARYEDIREEGQVTSKAVLLAVGIDESGYRDILSIEVGDSENEQEWFRFFQDLKSRGLADVKYVVSDDHTGLVKAIKRAFQGVSWQRCQVHFMRNFMSKLSVRERQEYVKYLKDVFNAPDVKKARERKEKLVKELEALKPKVAEWLDQEIEYCFTVYQLPLSHRQKMKSTNMLERFNQEILRRTRVIRIFPNKESCIRLIGAISMEQSEEWQTGRRYLKMDVLNEDRSKIYEQKEIKELEEEATGEMAYAG